MGLDADAIAVAAGELAVVESEDALDVVAAAAGRPVPMASHRTGDQCVVSFWIKQSDGWWRSEVVRVEGDAVLGSWGVAGGITRRSDVRHGDPVLVGEARRGLDEDEERELVEVIGVSADDAVRMHCETEVVAEVSVAEHGHFVVAAVVPIDAECTIESGSQDGCRGS